MSELTHHADQEHDDDAATVIPEQAAHDQVDFKKKVQRAFRGNQRGAPAETKTKTLKLKAVW